VGQKQTMLGGLAIYPRVANFLQCTCAKNYENWLAVDKLIAKIIRLTFLAHPVHVRNRGLCNGYWYFSRFKKFPLID